MPRPIRCSLSVGALRHNLSAARAASMAAGGRPFLWAVVKAAAYGHGLPAAIAGFAEADGLALLDFQDAVRLRELGWRKPLLMLEGAFDASDVATARRLELDLAVHRPEQIAWLAERPDGASLHLHFKINSGMNRLGFQPPAVRAAFESLRAAPGVRAVTLMTHFARADEEGGIDAQLAVFDETVAGLPGPRSVANSAATFLHPRALRDAVRPGIALYGATPRADRPAASLGLRAAMTLESELIAVQDLRPGDAVGYGGTFVADAPTRVGIVACGYADGYPRHAPTGTPVAVDGMRTRTVGRVSMDMLAVDLGPVPGAVPGSAVELWGDAVPVDEVAAAAGTIGYELLCAVAPRVPVSIPDQDA